MKAISIHAYWAWAIIAGHKRFENRSWRTTRRGQLAIHCTKSKVADELAIQTISQAGIEPASLEEIDQLRGKIIGTVDLIDVVEYDQHSEIHSDPFAVGPFCFVLQQPKRIGPVVARGLQRVWNVELNLHPC